MDTAAPLATLLHITPPLPDFSGLNEIPAGAFEGQSTTSLEGILYLLGPLSWAIGDASWSRISAIPVSMA